MYQSNFFKFISKTQIAMILTKKGARIKAVIWIVVGLRHDDYIVCIFLLLVSSCKLENYLEIKLKVNK